MPKKGFNLHLRLGDLFTNHPWIKIISLVLAIALWFYVKGEINRFNY